MHDPIATKHPNYQKRTSFIAQNYCWSGLKKIFQYYIQNCHTCKYATAPKKQYDDLFKHLWILFCPQTDITLDFVTGIFISNGYNIVLIVVDY